MITAETAGRIEQLGATISASAVELEKLLMEVATAADDQMAAAARIFLAKREEHGDKPHGPLMVDYREAHRALLEASVAASNLWDLRERSTTLRSKTGWWEALGPGHSRGDQIAAVCNKLVTAAQPK